jgi:predicted acylesterase/phospholipase RssA
MTLKKLSRPVRTAQRKASAPRKNVSRKPKIALAMAGGGPLGAIYEIGALTALSEALDGLDLNELDIYVGVSAGGILGAGLANGITPRQMCGMFIESDESEEPFEPSVLMQPAFREYWERMQQVPPLLARAIWHYLTNPRGQGFFDSFQRLTRAIPTGVFSNQGLLDFLTAAFTQPGRSNDFRKLKAKLYLVATDLDSGDSVQFGAPGHDHVPIARAAVASSALPGLFPPVEIDGRCYLDGALKRTLHASVALKDGADLVLCLNPIVPYDDRMASVGTARHLIEGGLPVVLSQTLRAMVHSRMEIGMRQYGDDFAHADVVLFEPNRADADMFFTNVFSYSSRRRLCEHAYQKTRAELWERRDELGPILARHGISLNLGVLQDRHLTLVKPKATPAPRHALLPMAGILTHLSDSLEDLERLVRVARARRGDPAA